MAIFPLPVEIDLGAGKKKRISRWKIQILIQDFETGYVSRNFKPSTKQRRKERAAKFEEVM